jgi:hypothetical protein
MDGEGRSIVLQCQIKCPRCGHVATEIMQTDVCQYFYDCTNCARLIRPWIGDCCVFCSHGNVPCPPIQFERLRGAAQRRSFKLEPKRPDGG